MAVNLSVVAALCLAVTARGAPPAPQRLYQQHAPAHLQHLHALDYFMNNQDVANYYNHQDHQKQATIHGQQGSPARLESLEPDSEVELIPGAQQPQQPPQQAPVSPNLPGLVPGQRVFIVHMPVPGYRPGTIGGYQPLYIVAAGAQGNPGYAANGYQNAIILNPSGQGYLSPFLGYPGAGVNGVGPGVVGVGPGISQGAHSGLVVGVGGPFNRPFEQVYHQEQAFAYQPGPAPHPQGADGSRGVVNLSQLVNLQGQPANTGRNTAQESASSDSKRVNSSSASEESKEQEPRRNARPTPPHAQTRNKV